MKLINRIKLGIEFFCVYLWELSKSNVLVALESLRPNLKMTPGFIRLPLHTKNPDAILLYANLLTMTPGTVTMDIEPDGSALYAHVLFLPTHLYSPEQAAEVLRLELQNILEERINQLW